MAGSAFAADVDAKAAAVVSEMRKGGLVLVFRNTVTELEQPDVPPVLSEQGQKQAAAVGRMLRELHVPTGDTYTSRAQPAVETARLARFGKSTMLDALTDPAPGTTASDGKDRAAWFRTLLSERPQRGVNVVMVADKARITEAMGDELSSMQEGELVVVRPDVKQADGFKRAEGFTIVGRLTLRQLRDYWRDSGVAKLTV